MTKTQFYLALTVVAGLFISQPMQAFKLNNLPEGFKEQQTTGIAFTENKGQVSDQNNKPRPDVLYSGSVNGMVYHLRNNGISYQLNRVDSWKDSEDLQSKMKRKVIEQSRIYRLDINWSGINSNFTIQTEKPLEGYNNFYLEVCPGGVSEVKSYEGVYYKNIYNNIDLHYYQKDGALKYDYIVAPGADYKQIQLEIKGAENITLEKDGSVLFKTPLGTIHEGAPIVYQNGKELSAKWILENNVLSFSISDYNPGLELIIDPAVRIWGTYYGGTGNEEGLSCSTDASGNVFMSGFTVSSAGTSIATVGAHQTIYGGGIYDAFLVKFNSSGIRQWGTCYGGSGFDVGRGCATDASGNVYLTGETGSNTGTVMATAGSHQAFHGGNTWDGYLAKFNSSGVRQWATYYGSSGDDRSYYCATDAAGNVYMAGLSDATTGIAIASAGAHQTTLGGGGWDAFLVQFNSSGVRQWGTYYGGSGFDRANYCATDGSGNVYLGGETATSTGTAIATAGAHQSAYGGGSYDAFLAKFNSSGVRQWGTYYGGAGQELGSCCASDASGNVYLVGYVDANTSGTAIATAAAHQTIYAGGTYDAFLVKFDALGVRQWGTYYGGSVDDRGYSCISDAGGNVYLAGYTSTNSGTAIATAGSHQTAFGGGTWDGFFARFTTAGVRQWGTYYGGTGFDYAVSCASDPAGFVYMAGNASTATGTIIASPGTHQSTFAGASDAFLAKFSSCISLNPSATANNTLCAGSSINFTASITGTATPTYSWSGPNSFTSAVQNPSITSAIVANTGIYTLTINNIGCIETATVMVTVSACTGISQNISDENYLIYPNPFTNKVTIAVTGNQSVQVFNLLGLVVFESKIENEKTEIDLSKEPNGIYFVKVGSVLKKIIKE